MRGVPVELHGWTGAESARELHEPDSIVEEGRRDDQARVGRQKTDELDIKSEYGRESAGFLSKRVWNMVFDGWGNLERKHTNSLRRNLHITRPNEKKTTTAGEAGKRKPGGKRRTIDKKKREKQKERSIKPIRPR